MAKHEKKIVEIGRGRLELRNRGKHILLKTGNYDKTSKLKNLEAIQGREVILFAEVFRKKKVTKRRSGPRMPKAFLKRGDEHERRDSSGRDGDGGGGGADSPAGEKA